MGWNSSCVLINQADDGYQFWFFNPDGGYSRRVLITHASNNYLFPWGPGRASYLAVQPT